MISLFLASAFAGAPTVTLAVTVSSHLTPEVVVFLRPPALPPLDDRDLDPSVVAPYHAWADASAALDATPVGAPDLGARRAAFDAAEVALRAAVRGAPARTGAAHALEGVALHSVAAADWVERADARVRCEAEAAESGADLASCGDEPVPDWSAAFAAWRAVGPATDALAAWARAAEGFALLDVQGDAAPPLRLAMNAAGADPEVRARAAWALGTAPGVDATEALAALDLSIRLGSPPTRDASRFAKLGVLSSLDRNADLLAEAVAAGGAGDAPEYADVARYAARAAARLGPAGLTMVRDAAASPAEKARVLEAVSALDAERGAGDWALAAIGAANTLDPATPHVAPPDLAPSTDLLRWVERQVRFCAAGATGGSVDLSVNGGPKPRITPSAVVGDVGHALACLAGPLPPAPRGRLRAHVVVAVPE